MTDRLLDASAEARYKISNSKDLVVNRLRAADQTNFARKLMFGQVDMSRMVYDHSAKLLERYKDIIDKDDISQFDVVALALLVQSQSK